MLCAYDLCFLVCSILLLFGISILCVHKLYNPNRFRMQNTKKIACFIKTLFYSNFSTHFHTCHHIYFYDRIVTMRCDGNCLFCAIAHQIWNALYFGRWFYIFIEWNINFQNGHWKKKNPEKKKNLISTVTIAFNAYF